jgi:hypothetical protein
LLIAEPTEDSYDDATLSTRIDATPDMNKLAHDIWMEKAAGYASLVDVSEAGSTRRNGQLHAQALAMAARFGNLITGGAPTGSPTRVHKLRR